MNVKSVTKLHDLTNNCLERVNILIKDIDYLTPHVYKILNDYRSCLLITKIIIEEIHQKINKNYPVAVEASLCMELMTLCSEKEKEITKYISLDIH